MPNHRTLIEEHFAQGKKVVVCIWDKTQKVPARDYINEARGRFPNGDAIIKVTEDPKLRNDNTLDGRTVIRYHFNGGGGGGAFGHK